MGGQQLANTAFRCKEGAKEPFAPFLLLLKTGCGACLPTCLPACLLPQVPAAVGSEAAVLELCRQCGDLAGHRYTRASATMTVDFQRLAGAAEVSRWVGPRWRLAAGWLGVGWLPCPA